MNARSKTNRKSAGFTLVEMIGVLAVIAILASLLVPRVFQAIGDSKINNAAATYNSIKSAVSEYYGKYGKLGGTNGVDLALASDFAVYEDWDLRCLVTEGFAEKPFIVRIGNGKIGSAAGGSRLRVMKLKATYDPTQQPAATATLLEQGAYNLDGANGSNDISGSLLVEGVIEGVDNQDAIDLNTRIDGASLGTTTLGSHDEAGRVKYFVTAGGLANVRVYLAHK
jgi:prepilin-type N-terminal cleavage/methylation domain-containing protein